MMDITIIVTDDIIYLFFLCKVRTVEHGTKIFKSCSQTVSIST